MTNSAENHQLSPIIVANGLFLLVIGVSEIIIACFAWIYNAPDQQSFALCGLLTTMIAAVAIYANPVRTGDSMTRRLVLLAMLTSWLSVSFAAAFPFMLGSSDLSFQKAVFESVSAITTTGATVMTGLDNTSPAILFWRSLLHWYGGMGIIIGAMVFFPAMRIGGMQFFIRAGFEETDRLLPNARTLGVMVLGTYSFLTFLCAASYFLAGLSGFDAWNLSMSTMATGGLAVSDASFANYSASAQYFATIFMLLAGFPLIAFIIAFQGNIRAFFEDPQIPAYLAIFAIMAFFVVLYRLTHSHEGFEEILRSTLFTVASFLTGTGLTIGDYQLWGAFPMVVIFLCMFIGGCTGSTSGAIKIFRFQVIIELIRTRLQQMRYPHGVFVPRYHGERLDEKIMESVTAFFVIYLVSLAILTVLFVFSGLDLMTGFSAAVNGVGNVGPGLGDEIGPVGNYSQMPPFALGVYTVAMFIGRLEFMFFYVMVLPRFWKN